MKHHVGRHVVLTMWLTPCGSHRVALTMERGEERREGGRGGGGRRRRGSPNFASILHCVKRLYLRYTAAVLVLRSGHAPLAQCVAPHLPSASPESDTSVLRPESVLGPRAQCPSFPLQDPPLLSPGQVSITDAHDVRSELEVPILPSRFFTAEGWWLTQPGVQDVRLGLRTLCLLQYLVLYGQLTDRPLRSMHGSRPPCFCPLEPWPCGDLALTTLRRDLGSPVCADHVLEAKDS